MDIIEAREMLVNMSISSYAHMNKSGREEMHRNAHKQAFPDIYKSASVELTPETLAAALNGR